ncbi:MAG: MoaA/NifB/PqqE/SkfB family radical SAM enzyme [Motiliproteus sp.]|jgi:MoaA/NifB/PqqE/SkfB family radical SAM enzyme
MSKSKFWRITLDTNPDNCNLSCVMCEDHSPFSKDRKTRKAEGRLRPMMSRTLLEKVIREAAAMGIREIIPSTMGEPLLYPHFDLFLDLCHELNLSLNLTTNGTFPSREKHQSVEYWAKRVVPIGSDVKISWNGANDATQKAIMQGAPLQTHIDNARRFIEVRDSLSTINYCSVTMQLTFMRSNLNEIPDLLELALELGFDRIKGHQLWAHFPELEKESLRNDIRYAARWNEIVIHCKKRVAEHHEAGGKLFRLDNFFELTLDNLDDIVPDGTCPFLGQEIWVDPTGRLNVCCAPDQQRKTLGDFGYLTDSSLASLVQSPAYVELTQQYQQNPLCKKCNMRRPNA